MTKNNEGHDFPPTLKISGTLYGEDAAINMLRDAGYIEKTSSTLHGLIERRRKAIGPDARVTAAGNVLRLIKDEPVEGEVVDDKKE